MRSEHILAAIVVTVVALTIAFGSWTDSRRQAATYDDCTVTITNDRATVLCKIK